MHNKTPNTAVNRRSFLAGAFSLGTISVMGQNAPLYTQYLDDGAAPHTNSVRIDQDPMLTPPVDSIDDVVTPLDNSLSIPDQQRLPSGLHLAGISDIFRLYSWLDKNTDFSRWQKFHIMMVAEPHMRVIKTSAGYDLNTDLALARAANRTRYDKFGYLSGKGNTTVHELMELTEPVGKVRAYPGKATVYYTPLSTERGFRSKVRMQGSGLIIGADGKHQILRYTGKKVSAEGHPYGINRLGSPLLGSVAAPPNIPIGRILHVDYGRGHPLTGPRIVADRGGAIQMGQGTMHIDEWGGLGRTECDFYIRVQGGRRPMIIDTGYNLNSL